MKIYNTLTRKKEEFTPMDAGEVKMYVCGPTVYNYFHVGNARPFVVFDTLRRYLEHTGSKVRYVQNFTDVDDKIINRAREEGVASRELSERYIDEYYKDAGALGVAKATVHPKVTENMGEILDFVRALVDKGYAYESDGDVYFSTRKFAGYGKLSRQNIEDLEAGARVDVNETKADPLDFALWKRRKTEDEPAWESPWGWGRPGWHIECSAMSRKYLGETIDIHAGGQDLTFPHHENEIAQSEARNGKPFANYWMHNGYITIDDEKMSKSKGNFFTVRDILKDYDGETVRYFLLSGHYRNPINFSREMMEQARSALARMRNAKTTLKHLAAGAPQEGGAGMSEAERAALAETGRFRDKFRAAMDDDLNTADAISAVFELISFVNVAVKDGASAGFAAACLEVLDELAGVLGLLRDEAPAEFGEDVMKLVAERQEARAAKDFARADEIRDLLKGMGVTVKDTPQGPQLLRE